jgi:putative pyrimidine permease RutG
MLPRNKSSGEASLVIHPSSLKEINHGVCSGDDEQSCEPPARAFIATILGPVLGGLSIVVFGLIAATAGRIWVENRVDFSRPRNLITVAVALILGAGNFKLTIAGFTLDGIGTATFGAILLYHLLRDEVPAKVGVADAAPR